MVPGLNPEGDGKAIDVHNFLTFESDVAKRLPTGTFDKKQLEQTWAVVAEAQEFDASSIKAEEFVVRDSLR
jgi:hypothetical protein